MHVRVKRVRHRVRSRDASAHAHVRLAAKRRRVRIILVAVALAVIILLAGSAVYALHQPRFLVGQVEIRGAAAVPADTIRAFIASKLDDGKFHLFSPRMIFAVRYAALADATKAAFPRLSAVMITRPSLFATELDVQVAERTRYALWCADAGTDACYDIDATGFIYAPAEDVSTSTLAFRGGLASDAPIGASLDPAHFAQLSQFVADAQESGFAIVSVVITDSDDFDAYLADGLDLRGSFSYTDDEMISSLNAAMSADQLRGKEDSLEYIDLRFGDRVYYKFK